MSGVVEDWPPKPQGLDPRGGTRSDRVRMLREMRRSWDEVNAWRRVRVAAEVESARQEQQSANVFWESHRQVVTRRWRDRVGGRGKTMVADIEEVAAQYHPGNAISADRVLATEQKTRCLWVCPRGLGHPSWLAAPKDRVQKGSGCPACRHIVTLANVPTLARQYAGDKPASELSYAAHQSVPWVCRTWAIDPGTGKWRKVTHRFDAVLKSRALQGDGCLVCAGYQVDETNSLLNWFPEIALEVDEPGRDPANMPTSTHNVSRQDRRDGAYAMIRWRCRRGHTWPATILNRVQGGADCPKCFTGGISKEQVRATAELSGLLELLPPDQSDPRLPSGVPDFASRKIYVPDEFRPPDWRYGLLEIDACFRHPECLVALEYDGSFHHSDARRDRTSSETSKDQVLAELGYKPVRIRVGDLPELNSPAIICKIPEQAGPFEAARAVLIALEAKYPDGIEGANDYITAGIPSRQDLADAYITAVWGELRPTRRRHPVARETKPKIRELRATDPSQGSLLTPTGPPYRNSKPSGATLRDYRCQCGGILIGATQSQVTSGNTRSCGCLARAARNQVRVPVERALTAAAREWAVSRGIPVSQNGRVSARIVASYKLYAAGKTDHLNDRGLLAEDRVRRWATQSGQAPLLAKDRISEQAWFGYANDIFSES
jgi:hypothetical protein